MRNIRMIIHSNHDMKYQTVAICGHILAVSLPVAGQSIIQFFQSELKGLNSSELSANFLTQLNRESQYHQYHCGV